MRFPLLSKARMLESIDRTINVRDRVVILEKDGRLCEIHDVEDINEERILVPNHSIPWVDINEYMSPEGRVFVLHAPEEYVEETKHLAAVEQSTVIKHAVQYEKMAPEKTDLGKVIPWILVGLSLLLMFLKK